MEAGWLLWVEGRSWADRRAAEGIAVRVSWSKEGSTNKTIWTYTLQALFFVFGWNILHSDPEFVQHSDPRKKKTDARARETAILESRLLDVCGRKTACAGTSSSTSSWRSVGVTTSTRQRAPVESSAGPSEGKATATQDPFATVICTYIYWGGSIGVFEVGGQWGVPVSQCTGWTTFWGCNEQFGLA